MPLSLCQCCEHRREVTSGRGSRFLLCLRSAQDRRFPKYPHQPVTACPGFAPDPPRDGICPPPDPPSGGSG